MVWPLLVFKPFFGVVGIMVPPKDGFAFSSSTLPRTITIAIFTRFEIKQLYVQWTIWTIPLTFQSLLHRIFIKEQISQNYIHLCEDNRLILLATKKTQKINEWLILDLDISNNYPNPYNKLNMKFYLTMCLYNVLKL